MKASGRFISSTEIVPRDVQKKAQCVVFTPFLRDPWNDVKFIKNSCEAGPVLKMKELPTRNATHTSTVQVSHFPVTFTSVKRYFSLQI